ncbi:MAG TPA: hypothetical protein VEK74_06905 [Burkholderiaceae bacterium]|nr:hypothetical protein [Burkholderiaceae bacterium]
MSKAPKNVKKTTGNRGGAPDGPIGHWTQLIKPKGAALLAETLGRVHLIVKNHGPNGVFLVAAHGDAMDLPAGAVRATYAYGMVRVENESEDPVLIEFDIQPIHIKP